MTAGTLENPDVSIDEGYDPDIIATATKRTLPRKEDGICKMKSPVFFRKVFSVSVSHADIIRIFAAKRIIAYRKL